MRVHKQFNQQDPGTPDLEVSTFIKSAEGKSFIANLENGIQLLIIGKNKLGQLILEDVDGINHLLPGNTCV